MFDFAFQKFYENNLTSFKFFLYFKLILLCFYIIFLILKKNIYGDCVWLQSETQEI